VDPNANGLLLKNGAQIRFAAADKQIAALGQVNYRVTQKLRTLAEFSGTQKTRAIRDANVMTGFEVIHSATRTNGLTR
jgi:hypothetical protein